MKKFIGFLAVVFALVFSLPRSAFAADKITLETGGSAVCTIKNPKQVKVKWKVSNKKISVVRKDNHRLKFKADTPGKVTVTAKVNKQSLVWEITIKRKTIEMGEQVFETSSVSTLSFDNPSGGTAVWEVPDGINVVSKSGCSLSFVAETALESQVTAITKRYRYVWTVIAVAPEIQEGQWEPSESDLQHISALVTEYLAVSPYSSVVTDERIKNFCADLIVHLMAEGSLPPDNEITGYMDDIAVYLYTDKKFYFQ